MSSVCSIFCVFIRAAGFSKVIYLQLFNFMWFNVYFNNITAEVKMYCLLPSPTSEHFNIYPLWFFCLFARVAEAENQKVCCHETDDQFERSTNVSCISFSVTLTVISLNFKDTYTFLSCREEKDRSKAKEKKKKDPSELKQREV